VTILRRFYFVYIKWVTAYAYIMRHAVTVLKRKSPANTGDFLYSIAFIEPAMSMSLSLKYSIPFTKNVNTSVSNAANMKHCGGMSG